MIRIYKKSNIRIGFTLVEMVIVIGIIVILAAALLTNVNDILNTGNRANKAVADASVKMGQNINDSERKLSEYNF